MLKKLLITLSGVLVTASYFSSVKAEVDCSPLDPRASIAAEKEAKVQVSVNTLFKIAKAGGSVEGKLREEIQNLQKNTTVSEQGQIKLRTIYLFCGIVANAKDIPTERKIELYRTMTDLSTSPVQKKKPKTKKHSMPKSNNHTSHPILQSNQLNTQVPSSISQNLATSPGSIQIGKNEGIVYFNKTPPSIGQTIERVPTLLPPQERLLELLVKYQKQFAVSKLIISRTDGTLIFDNDPKRGANINLFTDLYGVIDNKNEERFEELLLSIPNEYVRFIPEMRWDSPFILNVTEAGIKYLKMKH